MQKWGFLFWISISGVCAFAQEPWGSIDAEPNPCRIEPGTNECTSFIRWETRGVDRAKVFVTSEGRRSEQEREFGASLSCETRRCRAPWINADTTYTFQLVDFTRGDRGRVLASVVVTGRGGGERRDERRAEGGAEGTISADPNPCRMRPGDRECTTFLTWHTRGVDRAKVFVTAEGRRREVEHEFSESPNCEPGDCRAPWIAPETKYIFELVDFSRGDRGRVLASVTVRGEER
jgi:hypothetical protein